MLSENIYLYQQKKQKQPETKDSCLKNYRILEQIGSGSFGKIYKIQEKKTNKLFALKSVRKSLVQYNRKEHHIFIEKLMLQNIKNNLIVDLKMTFHDNTNIYFLLEYLPNKSLSNFIHERKMEEKEVRFFAAEIVNILELLQKKGIAHRDLKPENIMLDSKNHLKLIDFGTASSFKLKNKNNDLYFLFKQISKRFKKKYSKISNLIDPKKKNDEMTQNSKNKNWRLKETVGTSFYIAPESINCSDNVKGCDFWSFGIIIFKMLTGYYPFTGQDEEEIFSNILNRKFFMPPFLSENAKDLINRLLVVDPEERLGNGAAGNGFEDLKNHGFFKEINFEKISDLCFPFAKKNKLGVLNEVCCCSHAILKEKDDHIILTSEVKYRFFFLFWSPRKIILCKNGKLIIKKGNRIEKEIQIQKSKRVNYFKNRIMIGTSLLKSYDFILNKNQFGIWKSILNKFF